MARNHKPEDQDSLFSREDEKDPFQPEDENGTADLSAEEERLRNGDISFRPVTLPTSEAEPVERKGGHGGGNALMIVSAIVVVLLLTYVVHTFYSPTPDSSDPQQQAGLADNGGGAADSEVTDLDQDQAEPADAAAMFEAHADLQEKYRQSESRVAQLENELETVRNRPAATGEPAVADPADQGRLSSLEEENRQLKATLEQKQLESRSAVTRAEKLVDRAEAQVTEEQGRTRKARTEAEQLAGERDVLAGERDALRERVAALETESARYKSEYDLLSASTTTRLEGESEAVKQLINRHARELETARQEMHARDEEIERLKTLIARLSVADPGSGSTRTAGRSAAGSGGSATTAGSDTLSPPRILTRKEPAYPVNARRLRVEGTVLLNVLVGSDGKVREVKVLEADGGKLLSPSAVDAVREWTFSPATRGGRSVECWHKVPIRFEL